MLETERLILRQWRDEDYPDFAQLNADPLVTRYFPSVLSVKESYERADKLRSLIASRGWGLWAVELKATGEFIGVIGLHAHNDDSDLPYAPLTEIAWRIFPSHWGRGYAPEAARCSLQFAFEHLELEAVYSFTALINIPSQRVMIKAGMVNTGEEFDHPKLESGHDLEWHCLYRLTKDQWLASLR
ncbi:GNAT family N-acetyltransferase [Carnimonas bestiolae]|uniref:GNAT family N-acetyltransferase n=1 Tax=Carnimonas bestiolae TaxID=3402172 RepID=UPI003EDC0F0C